MLLFLGEHRSVVDRSLDVHKLRAGVGTRGEKKIVDTQYTVV